MITNYVILCVFRRFDLRGMRRGAGGWPRNFFLERRAATRRLVTAGASPSLSL